MFKKLVKGFKVFCRVVSFPIVYPILEINYQLNKKRNIKMLEHYSSIFPVTIVKDRYNGSYSGGMYIAFNLDHYRIPNEVDDGDIECMKYWVWVKNTYQKVGVGSTPNDAYNDLIKKLNQE